jgi:hypothetical protein
MAIQLQRLMQQLLIQLTWFYVLIFKIELLTEDKQAAFSQTHTYLSALDCTKNVPSALLQFLAPKLQKIKFKEKIKHLKINQPS